jgi:hypothetical protein
MNILAEPIVVSTIEPPVYGAYTIKPKRPRRSKAVIGGIRGGIKSILEKSNPQTARQVFYAATVAGLIAKNEKEYQRSGVDAARDIEATLRRYAPSAEIHFERPAVTREQVEEWNLPTRPTKTKDPRAKKFANTTSVELDAIPADKLRALVRECIERHVDQHQLKILKVAEESERGLLRAVAAIHAGGRP